MLVLVCAVLGVIIGYIQGGNSNSFSLLYIKFGFLVVIACCIQIVLCAIGFTFNLPATVNNVAQAVSYLMVIGFMLLNRQIRFMGLIATGLLLNLIALITDGSTPAAVAFAGTPTSSQTLAPLWFLGDVFSLPQAYPGATGISLGDILVAIGILIVSRDIVLARAVRPQVSRVRYEPKHLAR
ncbi:MAG TPA: DUF5317 family protein [Candidatus Aquicultor sp.]|jgi:hypothetical protein